MAVGVVGGALSAVTDQFGTGEVVTSQRMANLVATTNYLYSGSGIVTYKTSDKIMWLTPRDMIWSGTEYSTVLAASGFVSRAGAGSKYVYARIPLFLIDGSKYQRITEIAAKINKASTGTGTLQWIAQESLGDTSTPVFTTLATLGTSSSSGHQTITSAAITINNTSTSFLYAAYLSGDTNDDVYAFKITYNDSQIV